MTGFDCQGLHVDCFIPEGSPKAAVFVLTGGEDFGRLTDSLKDSGAAVFGISGMSWNDLSPWPAAPVFRDEGFTGRAEDVLRSVLAVTEECGRMVPMPEERILAGYSLAGLFALWSGFRTSFFTRVMSASGSLWFDGFTGWMAEHMDDFAPCSVYLSLGDREKNARNSRMARVEDATRTCEQLLRSRDIPVCLEMNPGGHFQDPGSRIVKGLRSLLSTL